MKDEEKAQAEGEEMAPETGGAEGSPPVAEARAEESPPQEESPPAEEARAADFAEGSDPAGRTPGEVIAALEGQVAELQDQYLRKAADFENFRKRMNREKQESVEFANQSLILDLLPIIDDLERAVRAAETVLGAGAPGEKDFGALLEGISMTEKRLLSQLENRWGLTRYDSAGESFDPNRHEAIMMEKSPDVSDPVVQEDFIRGYVLKDRVIRAAKVKVLMPGSPEGAAGSGASPGMG